MSAGEIANIYSSINNIQLGLNEVTGNTFSNYNQLSRIVAQQANIYNSVYYGSGNILTGNIVINNNANINGGIIQNYNQAILCNNGTYNFELAAGATGAYIDFHTSSNITNDYDSRIIATGGGLMGSGNITLDARNVSITGNLSTTNILLNTLTFSNTTPFRIERGQISVPANTPFSGTFSSSFSSTPLVFINIVVNNTSAAIAYLKTTSTTGFTGDINNVADGAYGAASVINWIAIGT